MYKVYTCLNSRYVRTHHFLTYTNIDFTVVLVYCMYMCVLVLQARCTFPCALACQCDNMYLVSHPWSYYVPCREPDVHAREDRIPVGELPRSDGCVMSVKQFCLYVWCILLHTCIPFTYIFLPPPSHITAAVSFPSSSCSQCGGLLRPHVVWFGEPLEVPVMDTAQQILRECDLCLLVRELCGGIGKLFVVHVVCWWYFGSTVKPDTCTCMLATNKKTRVFANMHILPANKLNDQMSKEWWNTASDTE